MPVPDVSSVPLADLLRLEGRVAVVTGAAQGIGHSIALRFAEAGADIVLADLNKAAAKEASDDVGKRCGRRCVGIDVDVSDSGAVAELADRTVREFGAINIWVNNAGIYPIAPLLDLEVVFRQ